jgi:Zn-dependent protease
MGLISLLVSDAPVFFLIAIPLLFSIVLHEYAHGYVAVRLGDRTPLYARRLSLNPKHHLDPIGTVCLLVFGFGWARPVPVNFLRMKDPRKGLIYVSSAGIVANLILALLCLLAMRLLPSDQEVISKALYYTAQVNVILASFNLIPIPPLDGSKILMGLSRTAYQSLSRLEPYGMYVILALLVVGALDPLVALFRLFLIKLASLLIPL